MAHDLELHQLMHDAEADTDAQRQQPLPRRPDELAEGLLDLRWERSSPDNAGPREHHRIARVRQARRSGATKVNR